MSSIVGSLLIFLSYVCAMTTGRVMHSNVFGVGLFITLVLAVLGEWLTR